jgi:hypothetical protein
MRAPLMSTMGFSIKERQILSTERLVIFFERSDSALGGAKLGAATGEYRRIWWEGATASRASLWTVCNRRNAIIYEVSSFPMF